MAERRIAGWPWRKKSSAAAAAAAQDSAAIDAAALLANAVAERRSAEEAAAALKEELEAALRALEAKEATVKQHEKVAEDAVSGWEAAEAEASLLKQELQAASLQNSAAADRAAQLDAALKECTRQIRQVKEEEAAKLSAEMASAAAELAAERASAAASYAALERRLAESDGRSSALAKSLQERGRKLVEANDAIAKMEAEAALLQMKLAAADKEAASLKYELHVATKELEIRNEEVEFVKKSADAAHRQHLENVKKMASLEADVSRLRNLLKKKLPGPAAVAQMRKEVENIPASPPAYARENVSVTPDPSYKRRGSSNRSPSSSAVSDSRYIYGSPQNGGGGGGGAASSLQREMEMLRDRMLSVEEENNLLKEALSRRHGELQASRLLCARTVTRLSIAEEELESALQQNGGAAGVNGGAAHLLGGGGGGDEDNNNNDDDAAAEVSCAESWASALISELAHLKKESPTTTAASANGRAHNDDDHLALPESFGADPSTPEYSGVEAVLPELSGGVDAVLLESTNPELSEVDAPDQEIVTPLIITALDSKLSSIAMASDAQKQQLSELEKAIRPPPPTGVATIDEAAEHEAEQQQTDATAAAETDNGSTLKYICAAVSAACLSRSMGELAAAVEKTLALIRQCDGEAAAGEESGGAAEVRLWTASVVRGERSLLELVLRLGLVLCEATGAERVALEEALNQEVGGGAAPPPLLAEVEEVAPPPPPPLEGSGGGGELAEMKERAEAAARVAEAAAMARAAEEAATWKASVETLKGQLEEERRARAELEEKLQSYCDEEEESSEDPASRKERELIAAKEKLVECQRTITVLGKQLTALSTTSPRGGGGGGHSPAASFDTTSSSMESGLMFGPNGPYNNNNNNNNYYNNQYHHHHQFMAPMRESFDDTSIPHSARYQNQHHHRFLQAPSTPPPRLWSRQMEDAAAVTIPPPTRPYHNNNNLMDHQQYGFDHARLSGPILGYQYNGNGHYHHHHHSGGASGQIYGNGNGNGNGNGVSDGAGAVFLEQEEMGNPSMALTVYRAPQQAYSAGGAPPVIDGAAAAPVSPVKDSALSRLFKSKKKR